MKGELVGSFSSYLPLIGRIESRYQLMSGGIWMRDNFRVPIIAVACYLLFILIGRKVMSYRKPFILKRPLFLWNIGLAVFSLLVCLSIIPHIIHANLLYGIRYTYCNSWVFSDPHILLWNFLFCFYKIIELCDTAFIILRKRPLQFLHWYHHVTVLLYCYYACGQVTPGTMQHYFSSSNAFVHAIMYSYYALRAADVRLHPKTALFITILQVSQMFFCLLIICTAYLNYLTETKCDMHLGSLYYGAALYGSYAVLFVHYFIRRYL